MNGDVMTRLPLRSMHEACAETHWLLLVCKLEAQMQFDCRVRGMKVHSVTSGSFFEEDRVVLRAGGGGGLQVNTVQPDAMIVALKG